MPYQNYVTPSGDFITTKARGLFMGNRGILHDENQRIIRPFKHQNWVICLTCYKDRERKIMSPGRYTELFFLDEATALAAGHRPCGECQRDNYHQFKTLFEQAHGTSHKMDALLSQARMTQAHYIKDRTQKRFTAVLGTLPDYVFILHENEPHLWLNETLYLWTAFSYDEPQTGPKNRTVTVLTPAPTVEVLRLGYQPQLKA